MSSVMRPSGPLPPRIYWVRRVFALVVLVVTIAILWWCVQKVTGNADESEPTATSASASDPGKSGDKAETDKTSSDEQTPTAPPDEPSGTAETPTAGTDNEAPEPTKQVRKHKKKKVPLLAPTGGCDVTQVGMAIDVSDVAEGKANPIRLQLTGPAGTACTQAITPGTLVLRITSGKDVVWSSDDCPDKLLASEVVVRADPAGVYEFNWNGRRSTGSCAGAGAFAEPGGYWVEAALIGADSHKAFFDVLG